MGDTVYVGSEDSHLHALAARTGEERWSFATGDGIASSPAIVDGFVYVGSWDNHLYALDAATGEERWRYVTGNVAGSTPAVVNGVVYIGSWEDRSGTSVGQIHAVDGATGRERWRVEAGELIVSSPAVVDGVVYIGVEFFDVDGFLLALDAETGRELWRFQADASPTGDPVVADGVVYVGSEDDVLFALDAATGVERWRLDGAGSHLSSAAVTGGMVVIAGGGADLYAVVGTEPVVDVPDTARGADGADETPTTDPTSAGTRTSPTAPPSIGGSTPATGGTSYTSPTYGYSLAWDGNWSVAEQHSEGGTDHLVLRLTVGATTVFLTGSPAFGADAVACREGTRAQIAADFGVADLTLGRGDDGQPNQGGDASGAYGVYGVSSAEAGTLGIFVDCRPLPGGATLALVLMTRPEAAEGDADAVGALLVSLKLPVADGQGNAGMNPAPADSPATPAAEATPVSTLCDAQAAFRADAIDRINQAQAAEGRVAGSTRSQDWEPATDLVETFAAAQRAAAVPPGAETAQQAAVELLEEMARDMAATTSAHRARERGDYLNSVPDWGLENIYALIDRATTELNALPERCAAVAPIDAGETGPSAAPPAGAAYTCPPDQAIIDQNRALAANNRAMASSLPNGSAKAHLLATAAYADQLADDMIAACAG
jgi:hypothetical protein